MGTQTKTWEFSDRLLSVAYYLGLAPVAGFWRSHSSNPLVRHHHAQAMAAACFLLSNRASTVLDHALWFALTGPGELKKLN